LSSLVQLLFGRCRHEVLSFAGGAEAQKAYISESRVAGGPIAAERHLPLKTVMQEATLQYLRSGEKH